MRRMLLSIMALIALSGCGQGFEAAQYVPVPNLGPSDDGLVVRGLAVMTITRDQEFALHRFFRTLLIDQAFAGSGSASTTITYNNAPNVQFTVDASQFTPGVFTGNTLGLGNITVTALRDNNLKQCGTGGNQKCTTALMSVYTTGSIQGFVNSVDGYGVPVYASGLNPTTAVTLGSPGVTVEQLTGMAASKHTVNLSDFPTPTYSVTSDFTNGGSGSYTMTLVIQYALAP